MPFPQASSDAAFQYAPKFTIGGNIRYEADLGPVRAVFNTDVYHASRIYYSPFKSDLTLSSAPYTLVNARIDFDQIAGTNLAIGLFMRNALDTTFISSGASTTRTSGYNAVFYNEPRMYGLELRYRFGR